MHQIAELNLVTMSIEKVEVRFLQREKFKTHTSLSFSTAQTILCDPHTHLAFCQHFSSLVLGYIDSLGVVTWQCWAKGILLASSAAYQQHLYQETQIRSDWGRSPVWQFSITFSTVIYSPTSIPVIISRARKTLMWVFLPGWLCSELFPLKFP